MDSGAARRSLTAVKLDYIFTLNFADGAMADKIPRSDEDDAAELSPGFTTLFGRTATLPLERIQTKEQQVAEFLRENILGGAFARGQKLKQAEIARQLDISITPVREALKLLEAEGYVQVLPHRGAVVAPFQMERIDELFQLRLAMEPKLTLAAAKVLSADDMKQLTEIDDLLTRAAGRRELEGTRRAYNFRFHFRLYACADMPQTLHFVRVLWAKYPFDMLGALPNRGRQVADEHEKIMDALRAGDARAAMRAMQAHLETGHRLLKSNYALGAKLT